MNTSDTENFCNATTAGEIDKALALMEQDPSLVNSRGSVHPDHREFMAKNGAADGWTPLHLAAHYGQLEIARALIQKGADLNAIADNEIANTPLHAAVAGGKTGLAELLKEAGARLELKDRNGFTPSELAKQSERPDLVALLE